MRLDAVERNSFLASALFPFARSSCMRNVGRTHKKTKKKTLAFENAMGSSMVGGRLSRLRFEPIEASETKKREFESYLPTPPPGEWDMSVF